MPTFQYQAINAQGKTEKGTLDADSARIARQLLRDQGLLPESVNLLHDNKPGVAAWRSPRLSATDLALTTRQLATLVNSGFPVEDAVGTIAQQAESVKVRGLLAAVRSHVLEGHSFAQALAFFPRAFPEIYCATVEAGEQSGYLAPVLERLADYTEGRQTMRQKLMLAMLYPIILSVVAICIVTGLLIFVVPQMVAVFEKSKQGLPGLTKGLIRISDFLQHYGIWLAIGLAALFMAFRWWLRDPKAQRMWQGVYSRFPVLGRLLRSVNAARYCQTLGILCGSGVPVLDAMRISAQVVTLLPMRDEVEMAAIRVREGSGLAPSLEETHYFPPMVVQLIASGEAGGKLSDMLDRAADMQDRQSNNLVSTLMGLFEPLLILVMGGVVLTIVLAILLPIFQQNQIMR